MIVSMNSSDYYKMVREYANLHGISIVLAQSEIGKRGAEVRKRRAAEKKKSQEQNPQEYWWNEN